MILEQHGFELHESTYMWILFPVNTRYSTTWLVEPMDAELWIKRGRGGGQLP